jgi:hypothetical protein
MHVAVDFLTIGLTLSMLDLFWGEGVWVGGRCCFETGLTISLDWPRTLSAAQAGFKLETSCLVLLSGGIIDMCHQLNGSYFKCCIP